VEKIMEPTKNIAIVSEKLVLLLLFLFPPLVCAQTPVYSDRWISIGPAPLFSGYTIDSGRVLSIAVNPSNANHWLIGSTGGGIWTTFDGGTTWSPRTDGQSTLFMGAIAFAPGNPNIVYAGTGNFMLGGDAYGGKGLLKSTNGGNNWNLIPSTSLEFDGLAFSDITVDPVSPVRLLVATNFDTVLAGHTRSSVAFGVYKSVDGGNSWSRRLTGQALDLEMHPSNFNNQYAGFRGNEAEGSSRGVYRTLDAGENWNPIVGPWSSSGGNSWLAIAISPANPNVLYISMQGTDTTNCLGLWKTTNAWAATPTWTSLPVPTPVDYCVGRPNFTMLVDSLNADILYTGGLDVWRFDGAWRRLSDFAHAFDLHPDQNSLAWSNDRLIVANDGGVHSICQHNCITLPAWVSHNEELSVIQFYSGSVHPNRLTAMGGSQDNGVARWLGGSSWQMFLYGDGMDSFFSQDHPDSKWAAAVQQLGTIFTLDSGANYDSAQNGIDAENRPFFTHFAPCPDGDNTVLTASNRLWRTNQFFLESDPLWFSNSPAFHGFPFSAYLPAFDFAPGFLCSGYALGTAEGELRLTTTHGTSWTDLDPGNNLPDRYVSDLMFDPGDPDILYVTFTGFDNDVPHQPGHVFKTTNALSASPRWTNISPPSDVPVNTIFLDPGDSNVIFVGTDAGIWRSSNSGATWIHHGLERGFPNVAVDELKGNNETLIAFTHGRGAFRTGGRPYMSASLSPAAVEVDQSAVVISSIRIDSGDKFSGEVNLDCSKLPAGIACDFTPDTVVVPEDGSTQSVLTLTSDSATPPGIYTFSVVASNENQVVESQMQITVKTKQPHVAVNCGPYFFNASRGGTANLNCAIHHLNAHEYPVLLSCRGLPQTINCEFDQNPVLPAVDGPATSVLKIQVQPETPTGPSYFEVVANSGSISSAFPLKLNVRPDPEIGLFCRPSNLVLTHGTVAHSECAVASLFGLNGATSLSCEKLPAGVRCSLDPFSVTPPLKAMAESRVELEIDSTVASGKYNFEVRASNGEDMKSFPVKFTAALFYDDFEDGDVSDWQVEKGSWSVQEGNLTGTFQKTADILAPFKSCVNCRIETDLYIHTPGGRGSVLLWYQDKQNFLELLAMEDKDQWVLKKISGGSAVSGIKVSRPIETGMNYRILIDRDANDYHVTVNGSAIFQMPISTGTAGRVGFRIKSNTAESAKVSFRQLLIY
jgi:hypothetical protein